MRLRIEKGVYGGAGLARHEGKTVFVPLTLPGEPVEAVIRRDKGSFAEAELVEVLEPAPERVEAPCPYYGACGGCQYQHADYPAQLALKRGILEETLQRAGLRNLPPIDVHAGEPWGYRNRIRLHVDPATHALGYKRRGSHTLLPVETCPIAAPLLQSSLLALRELFHAREVGNWCAEVELFTNHDSSELLISFAARGSRSPDLDMLCAALKERVPELLGAGLFVSAAPRTGRHILPDEPDGEAANGRVLARWGESSLHYRVGAESYLVPLGAFFQGNRFLIGKLLEQAVPGARGFLAWDLYAGVGLFACALGHGFERVVAVEGAPASSTGLRQNLPERRHRLIEGSTLGFLQSAPREKPDSVVLDPPRAGLGVEGSRLLSRIGPEHITYVSCDPATLSRDLQVFADSGYTITGLDLVDMFPQTFHIETVAKLRRG